MKRLPFALAVLSTLWPAWLGAGWADRAHGEPGWVAGICYLAAARVCHQRPERSFSTRGEPWPVCARCAGLYVAAPLGAWLAVVRRRRPFGGAGRLLAAAALPTATTLAVEMFWPQSVTSVHRAVAALPLGLCLAYAITRTSGGVHDSIG